MVARKTVAIASTDDTLSIKTKEKCKMETMRFSARTGKTNLNPSTFPPNCHHAYVSSLGTRETTRDGFLGMNPRQLPHPMGVRNGEKEYVTYHWLTLTNVKRREGGWTDLRPPLRPSCLVSSERLSISHSFLLDDPA